MILLRLLGEKRFVLQSRLHYCYASLYPIGPLCRRRPQKMMSFAVMVFFTLTDQIRPFLKLFFSKRKERCSYTVIVEKAHLFTFIVSHPTCPATHKDSTNLSQTVVWVLAIVVVFCLRLKRRDLQLLQY